jgi:hypothetical protein
MACQTEGTTSPITMPTVREANPRPFPRARQAPSAPRLVQPGYRISKPTTVIATTAAMAAVGERASSATTPAAPTKMRRASRTHRESGRLLAAWAGGTIADPIKRAGMTKAALYLESIRVEECSACRSKKIGSQGDASSSSSDSRRKPQPAVYLRVEPWAAGRIGLGPDVLDEGLLGVAALPTLR